VGPLPSPLGGCEGQDEQNPLGGGPSNGVNGGFRWEGPQSLWRSLAAKSSLKPLHRTAAYKDL
jgi:hypothetical protein